MFSKPIFLLDTSCAVSRRNKFAPNVLIQNLNDLRELKKAKDSIIKQYLDKENLILITSDYRFAMKMILDGKKIIFVENGFDGDSFHIIYPSIEVSKSVFWKPDVISILQDK